MVRYAAFFAVHFTTDFSAAPSSGPISIEAASLSPYNIEVHWEPPSIQDQNGNILSYHISVTHITSGKGQTFEISGDILYFSGNNFHPYYTYSITVHAVTVSIGPGTTVNVTTMEAGK